MQKIWRFRQNWLKIKYYWRIFNLAVAYPVSMTLYTRTYAKILAVFNFDDYVLNRHVAKLIKCTANISTFTFKYFNYMTLGKEVASIPSIHLI